jgi:hypothetical protein
MSFLEEQVLPEFTKMFFEDDRINAFSYRSQPQNLRDEIHVANINYAFEYRPKMNDLRFSYSFNPDGINSSSETISWNGDNDRWIDLEIQRDRNRFLQSFPHLVMNLKELMTNPTNNPIAAVKKLLDIDDNKLAEEAWNAIKENRFLEKVSKGGGATPALQYATRAKVQSNEAALVGEQTDFNKLPTELQFMFSAYNLLHYGYRQSRSFLEILGRDNGYYKEVDEFISEDLRDWKENDPEMFQKYLRRTLDTVYSAGTCFSRKRTCWSWNPQTVIFIQNKYCSLWNYSKSRK